MSPIHKGGKRLWKWWQVGEYNFAFTAADAPSWLGILLLRLGQLRRPQQCGAVPAHTIHATCMVYLNHRHVFPWERQKRLMPVPSLQLSMALMHCNILHCHRLGFAFKHCCYSSASSIRWCWAGQQGLQANTHAPSRSCW